MEVKRDNSASRNLVSTKRPVRINSVTKDLVA
jgi:hypothetical protein